MWAGVCALSQKANRDHRTPSMYKDNTSQAFVVYLVLLQENLVVYESYKGMGAGETNTPQWQQ